MIEAEREFYVGMLGLLQDIDAAESQQPVDEHRISDASRILSKEYNMFLWSIKGEVDFFCLNFLQLQT